MVIEAKICGINDAAAMEAAAEGGAAYIGLNFYPPSPRAVSAERAGELAALAGEAFKVGLFVDPDDALLEATLAAVPLDIIQLHGQESPARVAAIRRRFTLPVMKAIKLAAADDLAEAGRQQEIADRLLFDAKAPKEMAGALPGGNALAFDWRLLAGRRWE
ncbi:MAG: phosphoribosylanthranilate isomerase, partial [Kiloniellales bacterium]